MKKKYQELEDEIFLAGCSIRPHGRPARLEHIIGEHAIWVIRFAVDKPSRPQSWARIMSVNQRWLYRICPIQSDATRGCERIIAAYSEALRDFILDSSVSYERLAEIAALEGDFYSMLVKDPRNRTRTRKEWAAYTRAVEYVTTSIDTPHFYDAAVHCIQIARRLGDWLEAVI